MVASRLVNSSFIVSAGIMLEKDSTCMHAMDVMIAVMHLCRSEIYFF